MLESIRRVIITQPEWELEPIHESQLAKMIDNLPNKSSTGPDQSSFKLLKLLKPVITQHLTELCNSIIAQNKWPSAFSIVKIIPVPKKKKFEYRKIGITCAIGRALAKVIGQQIQANINKALPQNLFGGIPVRSTADAINSIKERVIQKLCSRKKK